jgi:hypothetical protein
VLLGFVFGTSMLFALVGNDVGLSGVPAFRTAWWVCAAALGLTAALSPRGSASPVLLGVVEEAG